MKELESLQKQVAELTIRLAEIERHLFSEAWRGRLSALVKKEKA